MQAIQIFTHDRVRREAVFRSVAQQSAPRCRSQKLSLVRFVDKEGAAPECRFTIRESSQQVGRGSAESQRQVPGSSAQKRLARTRKRSPYGRRELRQITP